MVNKHHPASSRAARKRVTRMIRRQERVVVESKTTQPRVSKQPTGFARGAKVERP